MDITYARLPDSRPADGSFSLVSVLFVGYALLVFAFGEPVMSGLSVGLMLAMARRRGSLDGILGT